MCDLEKTIEELDRMTEEARAMDLEYAISIDNFTTLCNAYKLLKEYMRKETPARPSYSEEMKHYVCPRCSLVIPKDEYEFCPDCGQRLDWTTDD